MKKKLIALFIFSFLSSINALYTQEVAVEKSLETDSLNTDGVEKKSILLDNIKYDATDSITIDQNNNKIILYNNANKLSARLTPFGETKISTIILNDKSEFIVILFDEDISFTINFSAFKFPLRSISCV